ncbi:MAG: hypothetical protein LUD51_02255 [Clostridia bacterium]|nr:hypothetical protein [Clostridia bacterium]
MVFYAGCQVSRTFEQMRRFEGAEGVRAAGLKGAFGWTDLRKVRKVEKKLKFGQKSLEFLLTSPFGL